MSKEKIYIELSEEIQKWLAESNLSIENLLREKIVNSEIIYDQIPYQVDEGARSKDIAMVIIAGSAAVISIAFGISQILEAIYSKPFLVEICEIEDLQDLEGNFLVDKYGIPLRKLVKRYEVIGPKQGEKTKEFEINFDLKNGLVIKVKTHSGEISQ
jgi:hypothetical protein